MNRLEEPRLILKDIVKVFSGVVANDGVSLEVRRGEIHALLGENGAGKTTLMEVACGFQVPDRGQILIDGKHQELSSPAEAIRLGIGMVHQHFALVPNLTVAENVSLGALSRRRLTLDLSGVAARLEQISDSYGLRVSPWDRVEDLSVGELQRVEIIRALYRDAGILILDEPTSVLSPPEIEALFRIMRNLAIEGRSIVFITHKLAEALATADRITVLRKGRVKAVVHSSETDESLLTRLMVGDEKARDHSTTSRSSGETRLISVHSVSIQGRGGLAVEDLSLHVLRGEILGIAGVEGNGQRELFEALVGLRQLVAGSISIAGMNIRGLTHSEIVDLQLGFIPEDRQKEGLVTGLSVRENLLLRQRLREGVTRRGWVNSRKSQSLARRLIQQFDIATSGSDVAVGQLSGGTQQRLLLARELSGNPKVIVAAQPTRGLDIAGMRYVHHLLRSHRDRGAAIVLVSTNLDEVMELSDRVAVLSGGRIVGEGPRNLMDRQKVGLLMTGAAPGIPEQIRPEGSSRLTS